jgi:DNA-binding transcriptional MerR regulator
LYAVKKESAQTPLFKNGVIPDKLAYKVEEVSRLTKVSPETIEAWEKEYPFLRAGRTGAGQRFFRPKDVEIIRRIHDLTEQKSLTAAGIKRRVEEEFGLRPSGPVHPDKLIRALYDVRDGLQDILTSLENDVKKP